MLSFTDFRVLGRDRVNRTVMLAQLQTRAYVVRFSGVAMGCESVRDVARGLSHILGATRFPLIDVPRHPQHPLRPLACEPFHGFASAKFLNFGEGGESELVVAVAEAVAAAVRETVVLGWPSPHGLPRRRLGWGVARLHQLGIEQFVYVPAYTGR